MLPLSPTNSIPRQNAQRHNAAPGQNPKIDFGKTKVSDITPKFDVGYIFQNIPAIGLHFAEKRLATSGQFTTFHQAAR